MKKTLVIYYTQRNNNTGRIAEAVCDEAGGDLVRIETVTPYTGTREEITIQAKEEVERGYKAPIKPVGVSVADYDIIAIGTPTWWYTMAPAVLTFVTSQDWNGKTVIPFMTNAGWPGHVIADIKKECAGASFACEKEIFFDREGGPTLVTPKEEIDLWLDGIRKLSE